MPFIGGAGFLLLALLGSAVMVSGTLGRLVEAKDGKEAAVQTVNRTLWHQGRGADRGEGIRQGRMQGDGSAL